MHSEKSRMENTLSNLSPLITLRNARRIAGGRYKKMHNWALAMEVFGLGSTYARGLCFKVGINPDTTSVDAIAASPLTPEVET